MMWIVAIAIATLVVFAIAVYAAAHRRALKTTPAAALRSRSAEGFESAHDVGGPTARENRRVEQIEDARVLLAEPGTRHEFDPVEEQTPAEPGRPNFAPGQRDTSAVQHHRVEPDRPTRLAEDSDHAPRLTSRRETHADNLSTPAVSITALASAPEAGVDACIANAPAHEQSHEQPAKSADGDLPGSSTALAEPQSEESTTEDVPALAQSYDATAWMPEEQRLQGRLDDDAEQEPALAPQAHDPAAPVSSGPPGRTGITGDDSSTEEVGSPAADSGQPRQATRYRPPRRRSRGTRQSGVGIAEPDALGGGIRRGNARPVRLRAQRRGGTWRFTLLFRKRLGADRELVLHGNPHQGLKAFPIDENWYVGDAPDLAAILRDGARWHHGRSDWQISAGRRLYVLSEGDIGGFIQADRLEMGAPSLVICAVEIAAEVEAALRECGADSAAQSDNSTLPGWCILYPVIAKRPVPVSARGDELLDALRPAPAINIDFIGGIRISGSDWLVGFPPVIRLTGDVSAAEAPQINSAVANLADDRVLTAPGWEDVGHHVVTCGTLSRSYSIVEPDHAFTVCAKSGDRPGAEGGARALGIDGALVVGNALPHRQIGGSFPDVSGGEVVLGAGPGEIAQCTVRHDLGLRTWIEPPAFVPIWATPGAPMHADKRTSRIRLIGPHSLPTQWPREQSRADAMRWAKSIRECCMRNFSIEPPEARALWRAYARAARELLRGRG